MNCPKCDNEYEGTREIVTMSYTDATETFSQHRNYCANCKQCLLVIQDSEGNLIKLELYYK